MKKLLILSYYFPPLGLGGTQRIAKFVKYLPQFGWQPTVVTVKSIAYWAQDQSLAQDVAAARVVRTESWDPQRLMARLGRTTLEVNRQTGGGLISTVNQKLLPRILLPDSKILWAPQVMHEVKRLFREERFDALMTTSPPHSTHLIGLRIAKRFYLPWLADFRDGWAGSHVVNEPSERFFRRNLKMQQIVVCAADAVLACSSGIAESLQNADGLSEKTTVMTNGFDPEDFVGETARDAEHFTLCYSGTLNRWAKPEPFLRALRLALNLRPRLAQRLRVLFVGLDTLGESAALAKQLGLSAVVQMLGHRPHNEAVRHLQNADGLLLLAQARATDTFIPGKTFEYIGARKPIFAVSNSRLTNDLLRGYRHALVVDEESPEFIAERLLEFMAADWPPFDEAFITRFDRRRQTEKLAQILDAITAIK